MNHRHWTKILVLLLLSFLHARAHAAETEKDWNFLVFLNGKNDLEEFAEMNLKQMQKVGSNENINVLVEWGTLKRKSVQRLLIQKDTTSSAITSPVLEDLGPKDMGDWHEVVDFVKWAQRTHPARHTFLVIWDHGTGWHDFVGGDLHTTDISYDDKTGNSITTEQLGKALHEIAEGLGRNVDVYGSDACLMAMAEVADEVSSSVDYFVGSQELEPGEGWPYQTFLSSWQARPGADPENVAKIISREFLRAYQPGGVYDKDDATLSVLDMSQFGNFRKAMSGFASDIRGFSKSERVRAKAAASRTKSFSESDYRDIVDFIAQLRKRGVTTPNATKVLKAHDRLVVSNDQNQGSTTHGLSVWIPVRSSQWREYGKRYGGMQFNRHTGWGPAMQSLLR